MIDLYIDIYIKCIKFGFFLNKFNFFEDSRLDIHKKSIKNVGIGLYFHVIILVKSKGKTCLFAFQLNQTC